MVSIEAPSLHSSLEKWWGRVFGLKLSHQKGWFSSWYNLTIWHILMVYFSNGLWVLCFFWLIKRTHATDFIHLNALLPFQPEKSIGVYRLCSRLLVIAHYVTCFCHVYPVLASLRTEDPTDGFILAYSLRVYWWEICKCRNMIELYKIFTANQKREISQWSWHVSLIKAHRRQR